MCNGETAKAAAIYPFALCRAILTGFRDQMIADGRLAPGSIGLNCVMLEGREETSESHWIAGGDGPRVLKLKVVDDERFVDDLTGQPLDPSLCGQLERKRWTSFEKRDCGLKGV